MLDKNAIASICNAEHSDPFAILGPHLQTDGSLSIRAFLPGAQDVTIIETGADKTIAKGRRLHESGFFEATVEKHLGARAGMAYRIKVRWGDHEQIMHDAYAFGPQISATDIWLLGEGTHLRPYEVLGARVKEVNGVKGTCFAVWAPNASRASVVGDFNFWNAAHHPMRLRRECGVWELFIPAITCGSKYKFDIRGKGGSLLPAKADPYAIASELRPATASIVADLPNIVNSSQARKTANALNAPISIYEVHLGSWRRKTAVDQANGTWLDWDDLIESLIPYTVDMGFTHLELMPIQEFPFDGSWGYQPIGLYSPTSRFGDAMGFARFVAACHNSGLGVLLDWVPAHFPSDAHGLANFDGTHLYEYADPKEGFHNDWNTLIYNFGRTEVRNFLLGNSLYWLERYGVDGLRVDAVSSLLYRDYSREAGQWIPNIHGGRENLEAISFLQKMNEIVGTQRPDAISVAEESTAYPAVSRPVYSGGLGFHYKWNMGWMHDTLAYMARDPVHRKHHHNELTFSLVYAFNENFVLPISHDEVVHGKGSLLNKMPGDEWQKFANLRAYLGFMFAHPGKKLLFMGCEFAQEREWNHDRSLDWHLLDGPRGAKHQGVQQLVRDLNNLYRNSPALYTDDFSPQGFEWVDHTNADHSIISFIRRDKNSSAFILIVCNFTPSVHRGFRVGVPAAGRYTELLNTDSSYYEGANVGTPLGQAQAQAVPYQGKAHSILITIPPLATVMFGWTA
jgi:1,4-alpha-glucan branching enzyme